MGLFDGVKKAWDRNVGGAQQAMNRGVPRFYGNTMSWGNLNMDMRDPQFMMAAANPIMFGAPYVAGQIEQTRQRRELDKMYGPQAESAAMLARQAAISRGLDGGGAGFSMETEAYNDVMRERAEMEAMLEEQSMANQLRSMMSLSAMAGRAKEGMGWAKLLNGGI